MPPRNAKPSSSLPYWKLVASAGVVSFLSMFYVGYSTTSINTPGADLKQLLNESLAKHFDKTVSSQIESLLFAIEVNLQPAGAIFGALFSGAVVNAIGPKMALLVVCNVFVIIASILQALTNIILSFEIFMVGRFIGGIGNGMIGGVLGVYLAECSPVQYRGSIGSFINLANVVNLMMGSVFSLPQVFGTRDKFVYLFALPALIAAVEFLLLGVLPESPKRLYLKRRKLSRNKVAESTTDTSKNIQAERALKFFHGPDVNIDACYKEFEEEAALEADVLSFAQVIRQPELRKPLIVGILINVGTMTAGLQAVFNFSITVMNAAGLSDKDAGYAVLGMQASGVPATLVAIFLMDRVGRRPLVLGGLIGCVICNVGFLVFLRFEGATWAPICTIIFMVTFMIIVMVGPATVTWFIASELFPYATRPVGCAIVLGFNFTSCLVTSLIYLPLYEAIGNNVFAVWIVLTSVIIVVLWLLMPETKNKSAEEIATEFAKPVTIPITPFLRYRRLS